MGRVARIMALMRARSSLYAGNDASNRYRNVGAHLAVKNKRTFPARCGKYVNPITLGSESEQRGCTQQ